MEREYIHGIMTQNNGESIKSKCKEDIVFLCDESVIKAKGRLQKDIEDGKYC